jgi:hypothetical protein
MSITDAQNRPSNAQAIAATDTTVLSTNSIDLLTANRDIGRGGPMRMVAVITTAMAGGTSIKAELIQSADGALGTPDVLATGPVVTTANGIAGKTILDVLIPDTSKQYLGLRYTLVGAVSAGKVTTTVVATSPRPASDLAMNQGLG